MKPEEQALIDKLIKSLKRLEELEGKPEKDCRTCKKHDAGHCELLGSIFCDGKLPRPFYCNQYESKA